MQIGESSNESSQSGEPSLGIDVIVRVHDPRRLHELDRALLSLFNQTFSPVHPIIAVQNFLPADLQALHELIGKYDWEDQHLRPTVFNVPSAAGADLRTRLLNEGIARASQRFLAFLDSDDYVYEHAYCHLTQDMIQAKAAISFGDIVVKHLRAFDRCVYNVRTERNKFLGNSVKDLVQDNFCPIHSFVIDRALVDVDTLRFEESLTRLEDYDLLLRICAKYPASFAARNKVVGVYNWHVNGDNSVEVYCKDGQGAQLNRMQWAQARRHIWRLKTRVRTALGLS